MNNIPDGYQVMDDILGNCVVILNPTGKEIGRVDYYAAITGSFKDWEDMIRTIIEEDMTTFRDYPIEQLITVQKYLENISDKNNTDALEREWFIGVGSKCVGCLGMDKPDIGHLRSKYHACIRLEVNRNSLLSLIQASADYHSDQAHANVPVDDQVFPIIDTNQPVEGWRGFKLSTGAWQRIRLTGGHGQAWESNSFVGDCHGSRDALIEHIENSTHYMTGRHKIIGQVWNCNMNYSNSYIDPKLEDITINSGRPNLKHPILYSTQLDGGCRCGLYGFETLDKLYADAKGEFSVYTRVVAWGTVLVDVSNNFRASDITFTEIWINREIARVQLGLGNIPEEWFNWQRLCHYLADLYQVPVVMAADYAEIKKLQQYEESGMDFMLELNRTWPRPVDPDMGKDDLDDMRYL